MYEVDRVLVLVRPTMRFLQWVNGLYPSDPVTLEELNKDCTALLIPDFEDNENTSEYLLDIFASIAQQEFWSWNNDEHTWPEIESFEEFQSWFRLEIHSLVFDTLPLEEALMETRILQ